MKKIVVALMLFTGFISSSCVTVKPWQREHLADPIMAFENNLTDPFYQEITTLREASESGNSSSGGGCGCN